MKDDDDTSLYCSSIKNIASVCRSSFNVKMITVFLRIKPFANQFLNLKKKMRSKGQTDKTRLHLKQFIVSVCCLLPVFPIRQMALCIILNRLVASHPSSVVPLNSNRACVSVCVCSTCSFIVCQFHPLDSTTGKFPIFVLNDFLTKFRTLRPQLHSVH